MKDKTIISIDLKSFFASAECVNRGLDPYKVPLVVSDYTRGQGAITLAVSPYLRNLGVKSRCRLFELPRNIKIKKVLPRMKLYEETSKKVMSIYNEFVAPEDIHIYSIDEAFLDVTNYLKYYNLTDIELAEKIMKTVKDRLGLTTTAGIGPNIFLAKVAMDIEAKHNKNNISKWTFDDVKTKLWNITPISKIWGFGNRLEKKLNNLNIHKVGDINKYSREFYIKRFGNVMGNDIINKANGIYFTTIKDLNSQVHNKSMSISQVLNRNYNMNEAILLIKEMNDMLNKQLRDKHLTTKIVYLGVTYSKEFAHSFSDTISLSDYSDNKDYLFETLKYIYYKNIQDLPIRKVGIGYGRLTKKVADQISLFDNINNFNTNEYYELIDKINDKFGSTALLRASSLEEYSTIKNRERFKNII